MPNGSVLSRVTRASLEQLQIQFEALAPKFPNLQHRYIVHLGGADRPFPARMRESARGNCAMGSCMAGYTVFMYGQWVSIHTPGPGPIPVWESWYKGDGHLEFHALAERAGPQLSAFRVRLPAPRECTDILRLHSIPLEDALVLPDEIHRWPKVLYWLGWAGKVMPVERWAAYNGMEMPFDSWDASQFGSRPQSFHSIIDNLFLRSAAALEWMIDRVADGDSIVETPSTRPVARRPKGGRPADVHERSILDRPPEAKSEVDPQVNVPIQVAGPDRDPILSDDQKDLLVAALLLEAFDSDSRRTAVELVKKTKGECSDPYNAKKSLADLVKPKMLLESQSGRAGGYWLTQHGRRRAEKLRSPAA
jgi:hypothetical protein